MNTELAQQVRQALWPAADAKRLSVWAVLDCARSPDVYRTLLESRLEALCLYAGRIPRELEVAAPHLVELLPGHRLTEHLLGPAWGDSWGVFMRVADAANLRHHLRKFLKVRDESGRTLVFRYYDPRVLRDFLPTCLPDELRRFFGPVSTWLAEAQGGEGLHEFSLSSTAQLRHRQLAAEPAA